ncbi:MAG TPA: glycosyltransferase family 1 protein [Dehalococcoidia bacterium]
MRIAIDVTAIPRLRVGAGTYMAELVRALLRTGREHEFLVLARPGAFPDLCGLPNATVLGVRVGPPPARLAWEQTALPLLLRRYGAHVLHSPHHTTPVAVPGVRRVVTFHDVTFLILPWRYPLARRWYMTAASRLSARLADRVIAVSETVARDIRRYLPAAAPKLHVVREGVSERFAPAADAEVAACRARYGLTQPYLLHVGRLDPGKNLRVLLLVLAALRDAGLPHHLVLAGPPGWKNAGFYRLLSELELGDRVKALGYVPDEAMPALYSGADLFVFPSLYEGFGLPPLEAMACGTPVVASSRSAMPEVLGDAALLVEPQDVGAVTAAVRRVLEDEALRARLREAGLRRAAGYSWESAARATMEVYRRAVEGDAP